MIGHKLVIASIGQAYHIGTAHTADLNTGKGFEAVVTVVPVEHLLEPVVPARLISFNKIAVGRLLVTMHCQFYDIIRKHIT